MPAASQRGAAASDDSAPPPPRAVGPTETPPAAELLPLKRRFSDIFSAGATERGTGSASHPPRRTLLRKHLRLADSAVDDAPAAHAPNPSTAAATPGDSALAHEHLRATERSPLCATPPSEEWAEDSGGGGSGRAQPATAAQTGGAPGAVDAGTTRSKPPRRLEQRPPPRAAPRVECSSAQPADPSQRDASPVPASASLVDGTRAPLAAVAAGAGDDEHLLQPRSATTPAALVTVPAPAAEVTPEVTPSPGVLNQLAEQAPAVMGPLAEYLRRGIMRAGDELWVRYKGKEWGPMHVRGDGAIVFNSVEYLALRPLIESVCPGRGRQSTCMIFHGDRCLKNIRKKHGIRMGDHSAGVACGAAVAADDDAAAPAGGSNAVEMAQTAAESAPGVGNPLATRTRQSRQRAPPPGAETAARAAVAGGASALNCQPAAAAAVNPRRGAAAASASAARAPPSIPAAAAAAAARDCELTASQALSPSEREFIEQALEASLVRMADGRKPLAPVHTLHRLMQRLGAGGG